MGENELYQIAFHFREAIVAAKTNGEFNFRDRMHRFPGGCCDDTCDLLGFYLWEKYRIHAPYHFVDTEQEFQTIVKGLRP